MSRSKRDILETEAMLRRLVALLVDHGGNTPEASRQWRTDAESLRRISMTLQKWFELECGNGNDYGSWCITRGRKMAPGIANDSGTFEYDDDGKPYLEHHHYTHGKGKDSVTYRPIPDRETVARKRLASILARYPGLTAYVQTDPRGCALYLLKPGDVRDGVDVSCCYTNGLAVHQ